MGFLDKVIVWADENLRPENLEKGLENAKRRVAEYSLLAGKKLQETLNRELGYPDTLGENAKAKFNALLAAGMNPEMARLAVVDMVEAELDRMNPPDTNEAKPRKKSSCRHGRGGVQY